MDLSELKKAHGNASSAALLASLSSAERKAALKGLDDAALESLDTDWRFWARDNQLAPPGDWQAWIYLAGRGAGKTRAGAEWVRERIKGGEGRIAMIAPTASDARDVMVEGESGILGVCWDGDRTAAGDYTGRPLYEPSKRRLTWANGAMATLYSAEEPERLRGPQHGSIWCFIAGTAVETPAGPRTIETLNPGDVVLTRKGPRRVLSNGRRRGVVGRVTFDDGRELVGTADHLIYLRSGWTRMDQLEIGDTACAIDASNGMAGAGINTVMGRSTIMRGRTSRLSQSRQSGFTGRFGNFTTGLFRRASISTIATVTSRIMRLRIWNASLRQSMGRFIVKSGQYLDLIGPQCRYAFSSALIAGPTFAERRQPKRRDVHLVIASEQSSVERRKGNARNAARVSSAAPETTALSVASTWQREGVRDVYCLKVDGEPEYFANGVLVHNCDELAAWKYARPTWDMGQFGLRLGSDPRCMVTTTPKPLALLRELLKDPRNAVSRGSTFDNAANLAPGFLDQVKRRYEGTRLGRQELYAELLDEAEGALWSRQMIDDARHTSGPPDMRRIVVAIDPAVTANAESDETGIVVAGLGSDDLGYILRDASGRYSPGEWAKRVVHLFREFEADRIIAESNQGGDMVRHTLHTEWRDAPVTLIHAKRGKALRAEPVSALYEQNRIRHAGMFPDLEDQMVNWEPLGGMASPDRLDAAVYALTDLMIGGTRHEFW